MTASERYLEKTTQSLSDLGKSKSVPLEPGELILSMAGTVGKPIITKIKCCIHDGFVYFWGLKQDPEYLYYVFLTGELYKGIGKLGTQLNLNTDTIGDIKIPTPPLSEQYTITAFLDRETARIDALIEKKQRFIELLEEKRQAIISHAVTKGLDPDVAMKDSGVEWIGEVPAGWEVKRLKNISPKQSVGLVINPSTYVDENGDVPFLFGANIVAFKILTDNVRKISSESNELLSQSKVYSGDLVTVRVGYPGLTAVIPPELDGCNCASVMITRKSPKFDSQWLCYAMNSHLGMTQVEVVQYGAAQKQFNISHAVEFRYPVPSLSEQHAIATFLDHETARIDTVIDTINQQMEKLREYRTALISAAVTGKIDVRGEVPAPS